MNTDLPGASPVDQPVGRPVPERTDACAQGCNGCDECTDYDDRDTEPEGCEECAWGKVLGCWRCGGWGL